MECENCGAPRAAGASACPFCHSHFAAADDAGASVHAELQPHLTQLKEHYSRGKIEEARVLCVLLSKRRTVVEKSGDFLLLQLKILIETEGSVGQMRGVVNVISTLGAAPKEAEPYRQLVEAKEWLDAGAKKEGEALFRQVLSRNPNNPHALFLLGSYLYWEKADPESAARTLERCISSRSVFLRAWACLGAVYVTLGQSDNAKRAFSKCLEFETQPAMIRYFQNLAGIK